VSRRHGLSRRWRLQSGQGARVRMGGHVFVNFSSDDYLDLATDPRLARAAGRAARLYGCGAGASHLLTGYLPPHRALERALVDREGAEAALVFESCFIASSVLIGTFAGRGDAVFCDAFNHSGLVDGCSLSGAPVNVYHHADLDHLESLLRHEGAEARRRVIVTETLFGTDGVQAPLTGIVELAERHNALIVADESHATGILGNHGRGLTDQLSALPTGRRRLLKLGSLGKAFGSQGAFVCGPRRLVTKLMNHPRLNASAGALAVPAAAAARRAVALCDEEPDRRRRVLALADRLRQLLQARGVPAGESSSQIVPVKVGDTFLARRLSQRLEVMSLLVPAICPPFVSAGAAFLRISLTAGHTDAEVDRLVDCVDEVRAALVV
jgi:7-keto-8-aminopelargonate synthetase-like enzyme